MATPVFDQLFSRFTDAQAAGYARGKVAMLNDVISLAKEISKPSRQVVNLIAELENERYLIELREKGEK